MKTDEKTLQNYDFQEVMRNWYRMCCAYNGACHSCTLTENECKGGWEEEGRNLDWNKIAEKIMKWAKEHPEPVYPTWAEWLNSIGVVIVNPPVNLIHASEKMFQPIDTETAEKLGIEPIKRS